MNLSHITHLPRNELVCRMFYRKNTETKETVIVNFHNCLKLSDVYSLMCLDGKIYNAETGKCSQGYGPFEIVMECTDLIKMRLKSETHPQEFYDALYASYGGWEDSDCRPGFGKD